MSRIEDHFKDVLRRAVTNEPPVVDAWDRFERRARVGRRVRLFAAVAATAAVAVAAAVVVPKVLPDDAPVIAPPPSESPTPDPYAGWETFTKPEHEYRVKIPPGWRVTSFEDVYEIIPDGLPGTAAGERTFAVSIAYFTGEQADEALGPTTPATQRPDGRPYNRSESTGGDGSRSARYVIVWASGDSCVYEQPVVCTTIPPALIVTIFGSDAELWEKYSQTAEQVVASLEHVSGAVPAPTG